MLFGNYLGGVHPYLTKRNGKNTVYDGHKSAPKKIPHMCIFPPGKCENGLRKILTFPFFTKLEK